MAVITLNPYLAMDIRQINLNWYQVNSYEADILKNVNYVVNGINYIDGAYVDASYGGLNLELGFGGYGFSYNAYGEPTGGTVQGMYELDFNSQSLLWTMENISISLTAIYDASLTSSNSDELSILASALSGNDSIYLSNGIDYFRGYSGADAMYGYGGRDTLIGDGGADTLQGGAGGDKLYGGTENDKLYGDGGSDLLVGGAGADQLFGGADSVRDTFDFNLASESTSLARDRISNFKTGIDRIDLSGIDAHSGTAANDAFVGFTGNTATAYSVWYAKADADSDGAQDDLLLRADINGNTTADFEVAILNTSSIAVGDLVL